MAECTSLRVIGDPVFGRNVRCVGDVLVDGFRRVLDNAVIGEVPTSSTPARTGGSGLRSVDDQLKVILGSLEPAPTAPTPLADALGLVVARDVRAKVNLPAFDNSSMDGYAVRSESLQSAGSEPVTLRIVGEVAAGGDPDFTVDVGEAARIMTGAALPEGADAVIAVEDTDGAASGEVVCRAAAPRGRFVRPRGEDVAQGSVVVSAGEVVGARTIALLAACGHDRVEVHRRPHVVVLSTGDELVAPGKPLGPGQIHDSNSSMLWAAAVGAGASAEIRAAVGDTDEELLRVLDEVVEVADAVITSGGVSMGAYDVVKSALHDRGIDFVKVAMQPGKPQGYGLLTASDGRRGAALRAAGQPGLLLRLLRGLRPPGAASADAARPEKRRLRPATLMAGVQSFEGRRQFGRAVVTRAAEGTLVATPVAGQGSHFMADLSRANALFVVPEDVVELVAGEVVDVLMLDLEA